MKIPLRNSESKKRDELLASFLGKEVTSTIKVKVVEENPINMDEENERLRRVSEQLSRAAKPLADLNLIKNESSYDLETNIKRIQQEVRGVDNSEYKRLQANDQKEKEIRKVKVIIVLAILAFLAIYMFLMSGSKLDTNYDYFDPEMEFRHT